MRFITAREQIKSLWSFLAFLPLPNTFIVDYHCGSRRGRQLWPAGLEGVRNLKPTHPHRVEIYALWLREGAATSSSDSSDGDAPDWLWVDGRPWTSVDFRFRAPDPLDEPVYEPVAEPGLGDQEELVEEPLADPGLDDQSSPAPRASPVAPTPASMSAPSPAERQLEEMFARYQIDAKYIAEFKKHKQRTPHDIHRSGVNKEKAQANMCLSPSGRVTFFH